MVPLTGAKPCRRASRVSDVATRASATRSVETAESRLACVPEPDLPKLAIGDEVKVTCDNCAADLTAKIYFIATSAEYTPPVIYSLDERNKLVYLIQARPSRPDSLRVGQPISVYLNPKIPVAVKQ